MTMRPALDLRVYLVTDRNCLKGKTLEEALEEALAAGVTLVQYRDKDTSGGDMYRRALRLKEICRKYGVPLLVNDRLDVALAVGADGVHLGQSDLPVAEARRLAGPDFIIGATAHNVEEARRAEAEGADYLGCGAVFASGTKHDTVPLGLDGLAAISRAVEIPLVGIGGVTAETYPDVLATGADGAAVVNGILGQEDITAAVKAFLACAKEKGTV